MDCCQKKMVTEDSNGRKTEPSQLDLEAPEKVSVAYTMSVLASRCLGAIEEEFRKPPEDKKSPELEKAETDKTEADAAKAEAEADATIRLLTPTSKKSFTFPDYKGKKIVKNLVWVFRTRVRVR